MIVTSGASPVVGRLALEDGSVFAGRAFGACSAPLTSAGEVVFNTAMTGYQEAITDPSYAGQILTMTAPMIGNYGVNEEDVESARPQIAGFIVRELARLRSNGRSTMDLGPWLAKLGVLGLEGIDTRALVRRLRIGGAMRGVLSCDASRSDEQLVQLARQAPSMVGQNLAACVSPKAASQWKGQSSSSRPAHDGQPALRVLSLDCGAKRNIYRSLAARGCAIEVMPHDCPADRILELKPDGLFISNGPGDPDAVSQTIDTLRQVAGRIPTFGICLGHQLLALALGARTFKLKYGHRGANQPVRNLLTGRVEITSQNHGFCVEAESLARVGAEMTHLHLNDQTLAGFRHVEQPIFCVQYHPEASPGPHDSAYLFDCFIEVMRSGRPVDAQVMRRAQDMHALAVVGSG
jgi:carbamoyl-phosphate synthase small subunit